MKIFTDQKSRQTFFILLFGILIIQIGFLSVYGSLWNLSKHHKNVNKKAAIVKQLVDDKNQNSQNSSIILPLNQPSFLVKTKSINNIQDLKKPSYKKSQEWLTPKTTYSIYIPQGQWLNINTQPQRGFAWFFVAFGSMSIILLIVLILLCFWAINRLSSPIDQLSHITENLTGNMITKTGQAEVDIIIDQINQMQARLQGLMNDRTQMLAAISHDLRTPITRLKLRAESIENETLHQKVIQDLDEMQEMISAVLAFTRDDARQEVFENFDLAALLEAICNDMEDMGRDVTYNSNAKKIPFYGSVNALKRAFTNLIDNAIKYGDKAKVALMKKNNHIIITVEDEGPGIPEQDLEKVLEPFYRLEHSRSRQTGGMGLGLAIARDIFISHRGEMKLTNITPHGLKIAIILPV